MKPGTKMPTYVRNQAAFRIEGNDDPKYVLKNTWPIEGNKCEESSQL
jgi:hypothetical protein